MNKNNLLSILVAGFMLSLGLSSCGNNSPLCGDYRPCGDAKADKQKSKKINKPEYQIASEGFFLNSDEYNKIFEGSFLFWNPDVSVDDMAKVVRASNEFQAAGVASLQFIRDHILILKPEFDTNKTKALAIKAAAGKEFFRLSITNAAMWLGGSDGMSGEVGKISEKLTALRTDGALTPQELGHAGNYFAQYCEAKLWQRATYYLTAQQQLVRRPSPLALCEGMYQKMGLIQDTAPACAPAPTGKNYFECLWREGVLKTKLYRTRYAGTDADSAFASLTTEELVAFFANPKANPFDRNDIAFIKQDPNTVLEVPTAGGVRRVPLKWEYVPGRADGEKPTQIGNASISEILNSMESSRGSSEDGLKLLPTSLRTNPDEKTLVEDELKLIRKKFDTFGKLADPKYVNEVSFNEPFYVQPNPGIKLDVNVRQQAAQEFPEVFVVSSEELIRLKNEGAIVIAQLQQIGGKVQTLANEIENCADSKQESLGCRLKTATANAQTSTVSEDVALANLPGSIKLEKSASGLLLVTVALDRTSNKKPISACVELQDDAKCQGDFNASARVDKDNGQIALEYLVKDPAAAGMVALPRADFQLNYKYNELNHDQVEGQLLRIDVGLNQVEDVLTTMTGNIRITPPKNAKDVVYSGGIKMSDSLPELKRRLKEFGAELRAFQATNAPATAKK